MSTAIYALQTGDPHPLIMPATVQLSDRRLARTIFVGSAATLKSAHKGIDQRGIWLGTPVITVAGLVLAVAAIFGRQILGGTLLWV